MSSRDEEWAQPAAVRLENLRSVVEEQRIDALLDAGQHSLAVGDIENLIARQPLRERPRAQLIDRALPVRPAARRASCLPVL